MKIQMVDLGRQYEELKKEIDESILRVLDSGQFIHGPDVKDLEGELTAYVGVGNAVGCGNGTDALQIALMSLGVGPGDEVITTPFTFVATAEVAALLGAKTVFADICEDDFNIDPKEVERRITGKTKAIVPVHLFGQPAEMDEIMKIADSAGIPVVEDAAQAFGAEYKGRKMCSFGKAGCVSFFPSKNLGAYGDGGMIFTDDDELAKKIRAIPNHGSGKKYYHDYIGVNSRLDSIQAAILRVKFKHLDEYNERRAHFAQMYTERLQGTVVTPRVFPGKKHIFHQYTIRTQRRDGLLERLKQQGIPSAVYYPVPLHLQKAYEYAGYKKGDFPVSEKLAGEVLSLPMHPNLLDGEVEFITDTITKYFGK